MRSCVNYFIFCLAVSDLLIPVVILPTRIWETNVLPVYSGGIVCKIKVYFGFISITASSLTSVATAFERFYSIVYRPMGARIIRKRLCYSVITSIWFTTATLHIYTIYKIPNRAAAVPVSQENLQYATALVSFVLITASILTILYSVITITLHRQTRLVRSQMNSEWRRRRYREDRKVKIMILAVVAVYLVSWIPLIVYVIFGILNPKILIGCHYRHFFFIGRVLNFSSPAIKPFVYYMSSEEGSKTSSKGCSGALAIQCLQRAAFVIRR